MKRIILFFLLCCAVLSTQAQSKEMKIGDQLPDFLFTNVLNYEKTSFRLSDLQSKVTIIELWSSHCGGCLSSMIHFNELKKKYGRQVQFLFISLDSAAAVEHFLKKRKDLAAFRQPFWPQSAEWKTWFPTQSYPHLIWLDSNRVVKAITASQYLNEKHLDFLLEHNYVKLPVKKDIERFNYHEPFSLLNNEHSFLFAASFSGPIEGVGGQMGKSNLAGGMKRIYATNASYFSLYSMAWQDQVRLTSDNRHARLQLQLQDSFLLGKDEYGFTSRYCFEMIYPEARVGRKELPYQWMRQELDRFFGVKSEVVRVKQPALILFATDTTSSNPKNGSNTITLEKATYSYIKAANLVAAIELFLKPTLPVVYEGPPEKAVSLVLQTKYKNWREMQKDLQKAGLDLKIAEREVPILRISN